MYVYLKKKQGLELHAVALVYMRLMHAGIWGRRVT